MTSAALAMPEYVVWVAAVCGVVLVTAAVASVLRSVFNAVMGIEADDSGPNPMV